jgi:hypothetical protein
LAKAKSFAIEISAPPARVEAELSDDRRRRWDLSAALRISGASLRVEATARGARVCASYRDGAGWARGYVARLGLVRLRELIEEGKEPRARNALFLILGLCRVALALVFFWEGLFPKILFPSPYEIALVDRTGLAPLPAAEFLPWLGAVEIAMAALLLGRRTAPATALVSAALMLFFMASLPLTEPLLWVNPFGALSKNFGLLACAAGVVMTDRRLGLLPELSAVTSGATAAR